jgi:hypothetical protein
MPSIAPKLMHLTVVVGRDEHGRRLANVCPICFKCWSKGYFFLQFREEFVNPKKAMLGALGLDNPITPVCCGVPLDYVKLHPTKEEAELRQQRLSGPDRRKLSFIREIDIEKLVPTI